MTRVFAPREYQAPVIDWVVDLPRNGLWVPMGGGKTVSTLTAIDHLSLVEDVFPVLVIAPLRVASSTWPDEVTKWAHLHAMRVVPIVGTAAERRRALRQPAEVHTINYENLPWLLEKLDGDWPFGVVIADESTKLKSFRGGFRTHATTGKNYYQGGGSTRARALGRVAHRTPRWINLTGTPSPNGLQDLWGQGWFLDAGQRLGRTFESFKERWFQKSFDGFSIDPLPFAQEQIETALRDICLTTEVPVEKPLFNEIRVELPDKARVQYREMERKMWTEIKAVGIEAVNAAARSGKCLQIANGAVYDNEENKAWHEVHGAKLDALESVVEESGGAPVLVAYNFRHDLERLQRAFPGGIDLSTSAGLRRAKGGEGRVWFAHPASLGHGVDGLQEHCNIVAFFSLNWNLEEHDQIIERVGPMRQQQAGKKRAVYVHYILATGTVDELVLDRLTNKRSVQQIMLDAMKRNT